MQSWLKWVHRAEDALLVVLLTTMILLASTQILMRNLFDSGFVWIDPVLRVLVLWLSLLGATVATRENRHIRIDLFSKFFERNAHRLIDSIVDLISACVCLIIAWYGMNWILADYTDGLSSFIGVPAWILEIIVPLAFALIGIRYLSMTAFWARSYWRHLGSRRGDGR